MVMWSPPSAVLTVNNIIEIGFFHYHCPWMKGVDVERPNNQWKKGGWNKTGKWAWVYPHARELDFKGVKNHGTEAMAQTNMAIWSTTWCSTNNNDKVQCNYSHLHLFSNQSRLPTSYFEANFNWKGVDVELPQLLHTAPHRLVLQLTK